MALTTQRYKEIDASLRRFISYLLTLGEEIGNAEPSSVQDYAHHMAINAIGQLSELRWALQRIRSQDSRAR